jgi:NRPS condensation-like uncharacterized protein
MGARRRWNRLDNAAKIFPPTTSNRDTKIFRLVCELIEPVDGGVLQRALERTLQDFPLYCSILKKGLFWYYFEESDIAHHVAEESMPVCSPLYNADRPGLLFRVLYFGNRINFEVFHALADGSGAIQFMRALVFYYLAEKYAVPGWLTDYDASQEQKIQDAFYQYYDKTRIASKANHRSAYRVYGERLPDNRLGITESFLSVKEALKKAHEYNATLSEFLIALLICAIHDGMAVRESAKPVVITVPVDLRRFFPAQTACNFFGVVQVAHNFRQDGQTFDEILANVRESFRRQITKENLSGIISRYSALENNPLVRAVPLQVKILFLAVSGLRADGEDTAAFSNMGRISMPAAAAEYIRLFDVFISTKRPQICLCSFGDTLSVSISSPLADTGIQRRFFRRITEMGISMQIVSNLNQLKEDEAVHAAL